MCISILYIRRSNSENGKKLLVKVLQQVRSECFLLKIAWGFSMAWRCSCCMANTPQSILVAALDFLPFQFSNLLQTGIYQAAELPGQQMNVKESYISPLLAEQCMVVATT